MPPTRRKSLEEILSFRSVVLQSGRASGIGIRKRHSGTTEVAARRPLLTVLFKAPYTQLHGGCSFDSTLPSCSGGNWEHHGRAVSWVVWSGPQRWWRDKPRRWMMTPCWSHVNVLHCDAQCDLRSTLQGDPVDIRIAVKESLRRAPAASMVTETMTRYITGVHRD